MIEMLFMIHTIYGWNSQKILPTKLSDDELCQFSHKIKQLVEEQQCVYYEEIISMINMSLALDRKLMNISFGYYFRWL